MLERVLNQIDRLLSLPSSRAVTDRVSRLLTQAMSFYQGGFLALEPPKPWSLSLRERLRSKLIRSIIQVAGLAEVNRQWVTAGYLHQKGLEIDPLCELFYQRLMLCYRETGRQAEALAAYQRCCSNLSSGLGIRPSAETDRIHDSVK